MKAINAYGNVKNFVQKVEFINSSFRTENLVGQLTSAKDLFVIVESLKILESIREISEKFQMMEKQSFGEYKEMFQTWNLLLLENVDALKVLNNNMENGKRILETAILCYKDARIFSEDDVKACKESAEYMLKAAKLYGEEFSHLSHAVSIFEHFIMPKMSSEELKPEIELPISNN